VVEMGRKEAGKVRKKKKNKRRGTENSFLVK
jgi:hypothetical protein